MKLSEFNSKFFSRPGIAPPTTIYVFTTEESADAWIECMYFDKEHHAYELDAVIRSDMTMQYTFLPKWCNAEIQQFYAVEPDVIVVVVKIKEDE